MLYTIFHRTYPHDAVTTHTTHFDTKRAARSWVQTQLEQYPGQFYVALIHRLDSRGNVTYPQLSSLLNTPSGRPS